VALEGSAIAAASVLSAVLVPVSVKVTGAYWESGMAALLVKLIAPVPEASRVAPLTPIVNIRSVLSPLPMY